MREKTAKIRICAGNPGWYDPLTCIHLTITRPEAYVYEGQNITNIKKAISFGLVNVVEGQLEKKDEEHVGEIKKEKVKTTKIAKAETEVKKEIETEAKKAIEEKKEVASQEVVEETKTKKSTKRKTTK